VTRIAVLGAGRVGALIARELSADPALSVLVADRSEETLRALAGASGPLRTHRVDLEDPRAVGELVAAVDIVVGAVPGAIGYRVARAAIEAGRPMVDISFFAEDPFQLDRPARERGVAVVVDCGVAPGLSNLLVGRSTAELDEVATVEILVGGLPVRRVWPHEYRSVFSPPDVIEEYTRPCRMREQGVDVVVPALSGVELVDFPEIGTLEAFYTDGLRTLLRTIPARTLREKTLRYPGHAERMRMLRASGFFDEAPLRVGAVEVAPRAVAEALLSRAWAPVEGEEEFTLLRVRVEGTRQARRVERTWTVFDRTDLASGATSMARTTGLPCAIVARMLGAGRLREPGLYPPEHLGRDAGLAGDILRALRERGITIRESSHALG
jgi:saccharopine dehydrogenase-like NADP-dependent oxidoreductase